MKRLVWKKTDPPDFKNIPEKAGVYIISTRQGTDHAYEVKYVGQTDKLRTRITEHWSKKEKNKELKAHIAENFIMKLNYALVDSKSEREGMMLYMCQIFDPPYNEKYSSSRPVVECSLPEVRKHI